MNAVAHLPIVSYTLLFAESYHIILFTVMECGVFCYIIFFLKIAFIVS